VGIGGVGRGGGDGCGRPMSRDGGGYSKSAAARELGWDRRTVDKAADKCTPVREDARAKYYDLDDLARARYRRGDGEVLDLSAERARLARAQAEKAELDLAERRGELFPSRLIERTWMDMFAAVRAELLRVPSKVAPRIAEQDATTCENELSEAMREALRHLRDYEPADYRDGITGAAGETSAGDVAATPEVDGE